MVVCVCGWVSGWSWVGLGGVGWGGCGVGGAGVRNHVEFQKQSVSNGGRQCRRLGRRGPHSCGDGNPKLEGPRHCGAAQNRNHIPLDAVPKAICSLWATGAENLEDKREKGRTVAGPCTLGRRGRATANLQSFKVSNFQSFTVSICSKFQTFKVSNF